MKPMELALALKNLQGPDASIDQEVALVLGYRVSPNGISSATPSNVTGELPAFTASIDAAYRLAVEVLGEDFVGCSWEDGAATAKIADFPYIAAKTPAIAIVLAVVLAKHFAGRLLPELGAVPRTTE